MYVPMANIYMRKTYSAEALHRVERTKKHPRVAAAPGGFSGHRLDGGQLCPRGVLNLPGNCHHLRDSTINGIGHLSPDLCGISKLRGAFFIPGASFLCRLVYLIFSR